MALRTIPIERVVVGERLRQTNKGQVKNLIDSIREVGLINPITVGEETEDGYPLVAGLHRLEACQALGLAEIDVNVVSMPELHLQLIEVDENLAHSVLSVAQRSVFTAKRKEIYLALHPETAHGGSRGNQYTGGKPCQMANNATWQNACENNDLSENPMSKTPTFSEDTARKTGRSRRVVDQDAQRGAHILPHLMDLLTGTDFDRLKSLNAIMRMMPEQQEVLAEHLRAKRMHDVAVMVNNAQFLKVVQLPGNCTKEVRNQMVRLEKAWGLASDEARKRWARKLDKRGDWKKYGIKLEDII